MSDNVDVEEYTIPGFEEPWGSVKLLAISCAEMEGVFGECVKPTTAYVG